MAGNTFFAYRVQLPDGSEAIRRGTAEQPPTFGQLADFSANRGERFLGPAEMSPATAAAPARAAAPPPAPPPPPPAAAPTLTPTPASAPAPSPTIGSELQQTFLPERTFTSELPSIAGGIAGGTLGATVGGPFTPVMAGVGSGVGEAGRIGAERLMGWPPAEPGTFGERVTRAAERGFTGEIVAAPVRAAVRYGAGVVKPLLTTAERLEPVLAREVPATATLVHAPEGLGGAVRALPIDDVLANPAALQGVTLTPEMQQTLVSRWWQTNSGGGPGQVVKAWDALGEPGQRVIAGAHHGDMATIVESLRSTIDVPIAQMTKGQLAKGSIAASALTYSGHPYLAAALPLASEITREQAPRLLLYPPTRTFLAGLPQMSRAVAPPASFLLRTGGQLGAATPAGATRYQ